ncbi:cellulose binding domain-containing protein [Sorangium sp. So ce1097]|uniref:cellulose binding domain-containing protein n=1 Tax=Sorangium sp. So ce1097 TaxID=3133330 RepID=UPI003F61D56B
MEPRSISPRVDQHQGRSSARRRAAPRGMAVGLWRAGCGCFAWLSLAFVLSMACHPRESFAGTGDFTVLYANYNAAAPNDVIIEAGIRIRNNTGATVPLSSIAVRYWFTKNGATSVTPACWWWNPSCNNIVLTTGTVAAPGADQYVEIRFTSAAGSLAPGAMTEAIDLGIQLGVDVDEADDYSYGSQSSFIEWSRITVHDARSAPLSGVRGGTPPSGSLARPPAPTSLVATAASPSAISLRWSASAGATSYNIYRSTTPGFNPEAGNRIASAETSTSYNSTGLLASTTYYYKVTASNAAGESAASSQASATTPAGGAATAELFDDFSYTGTGDSSFLAWWSLRSWAGGPGVDGARWLPSNVSLVTDPMNSSNKLMRLTGTTNGDPAGSSHAEVMSTSSKFRLGTYAARMKFYDMPLSGARLFADKPIETFFTITDYRDNDPDYSEQDFEYMPNGGWGQGDRSTMWLTSWETTSDNTSTLVSGSHDGWHTLVLQITSSTISYYINGELKATHAARFVPEEGQYLSFQVWFDELDASQSSSRTYYEDADWVYFAKDATLTPAEVDAKISALRASSVARKDTVP